MHIFWQKRIRQDDTTTPHWFPSQTTGGSIREDRLVFPIPPGTTWQDAKPLILPGAQRSDEPKALPLPRRKRAKTEPAKPLSLKAQGGLRPAVPIELMPAAAKPKREPRKKQKNDPRLVAAARELRDRYLEEFNSGRFLPSEAAKYEVSRSAQLPAPANAPTPAALPAAIRALPSLAA